MKWRVVKETNRSGYLLHYGVLGMRWGIRKDDGIDWYKQTKSDMENFIGPMPLRKVGDMSTLDFIQDRGGLYSGDTGIVGRFNSPRTYQDAQKKEAELHGITDLGMNTAFSHDAWNSAEERDRLGVIDYIKKDPCKAMNSLLRGDTETAESTARNLGCSLDTVQRSIDGMTKILDNTKITRDMITDRRVPSSCLSDLLGVDSNLLKNRDVVSSLIGDRLMDKGFFSTTMIGDANNARSYGDVKLHTYLPKGSSALYMEEPACLDPSKKGKDGYRNPYRTTFLREMYEVCLNRDSAFKISGISMDDNDNITDIYLDLIGQRGEMFK